MQPRVLRVAFVLISPAVITTPAAHRPVVTNLRRFQFCCTKKSYYYTFGMTIKFFDFYVKEVFRVLTRLCVLIVLTGQASAGVVAWFYALDSDKAEFEKVLGKPIRSIQSGGCSMHEYQVGPHRVVAAKMGSGCVNTAATVATVMALNSVDRVISTGPAGGLTDTSKSGMWLRVETVMGWQSGRAVDGGRIFPGEKAQSEVAFVKGEWPEGEWRDTQAVKLVSGEAFVASGELRGRLAAEHGAGAVEMNAYGLLAGLEGRKVKVLILRVVSDRADEKASEDFSEFLKKYDGKGGKWVAELVGKMPAEKNEPAAYEALRKLLK